MRIRAVQGKEGLHYGVVPQESQTERDNMRKEVKVYITTQFGCLLVVFANIFGLYKLHKCYSYINSKKAASIHLKSNLGGFVPGWIKYA